MTETARPDSQRSDEETGQPILQRLRAIFTSNGSESSSVRDAIEELIDEQPDAEDAIDEHERALLSNVLKQRNATVEQIMVPRVDIISTDVETPLADAIKLLFEEGHSRVPVYRESLDEVIGMVHIKDLASVMLDQTTGGDLPTLAKAVRQVIFVAPTARVLDLLLEMRIKRTHMAMVVDEYGGIDGLVTIEDLVEQIVGEIADEHDEDEEPELSDRADGTIIADARVTLKDFIERYGEVFDEEECSEADTLGGLVFRLAGRVPIHGELVSHTSGLEFEITDADPRRIKRLRIRNMPNMDNDS